MVSLDGPPDVHNRMRCFPDGSGSYDLILANVKQACLHNITLAARATLTHEYPYLVNVIEHLEELGFSTVRYSWVDGKFSFDSDDWEILNGELERLGAIYFQKLEQNYRVPFVPYEGLVTSLRHNRKRVYPCGAGRSMMTVSVGGIIYACHRTVGKEFFQIGSIYTDFDYDKIVRLFQAFDRVTRKCARCWARYLCDHNRCYYQLARSDGGLRVPSKIECRRNRQLLEQGIAFYLEMQDRLPEALDMMVARPTLSVTEQAANQQQNLDKRQHPLEES